jgi:hypothetical protein
VEGRGEDADVSRHGPGEHDGNAVFAASSPGRVREGGKAAGEARGVTFIRQENGKAVYTLKSGMREFTSTMPGD